MLMQVGVEHIGTRARAKRAGDGARNADDWVQGCQAGLGHIVRQGPSDAAKLGIMLFL